MSPIGGGVAIGQDLIIAFCASPMHSRVAYRYDSIAKKRGIQAVGEIPLYSLARNLIPKLRGQPPPAIFRCR